MITDIWADRRVRIGYETAEELTHKFSDFNWRGHPESQADALDDSLEALHWIGSVKVNIQSGRMFDGHLRVKRALVKNPSMPIPVDYYDLTEDEELLALQIHDAITEQAEPIPDKLAALLERTRALTADRPGLGAMLAALKAKAGINGKDKNVKPQIDKAAELQKVWGVRVGDVWELGQHRLCCGDCTDRATVEAVMGGEQVSLYVTDPPYGVNYGDKNRHLSGYDKSRRILTDIEGDQADGGIQEVAEKLWKPAFSNMFDAAKPGCVYYMTAPQGGDQMMMMMMMMSEKWLVKHELIWVKDRMVFGRADYHYQHEPIIYGWKPGAAHYFIDDRSQVSIWQIGRPMASPDHPTTKPVALFEKAISNSSKPGDICADFFVGSGTAIIAGENLGRKVRAIEIYPGYCAVTLQRFVDAGGQTPRRVSG